MIKKYNIEQIKRLYIEENKSTCEIAKILKCDPTSVRYQLNKHGVKTRNLSESHLNGYNFNGDYNVLYGSLLGDASLIKRNKKTNIGLASFSKVNKNYDHVNFVGNKILGLDASNRIKKGLIKNKHLTFKFTTLSCQEFLIEYNRWYLNNVKIVPKDLIINEKILLHWFLDDGHSCWKHNNYNSVNLGLSTESFNKLDCEYLIEQLEKLGVSSYLSKSHGGYGYKITVRGNCIGYFFNLIGESPVASMRYKWKIPYSQNLY